MLSYRHAYHAGNFADILKHSVLIEMLNYFIKKDKPFEYIDTHAGAGLYDLSSTFAVKNSEFQSGIEKLNLNEFPELTEYFSVIRHFNTDHTLGNYPGSPAIARYYLRNQDRAWLFEKHPTDYAALNVLMKKNRRIKVSPDDGFKGLISLLPPHSRRALILVDPSYEIKEDYKHVFDYIVKAHKRFSTGMYAIWYPVVERNKVQSLEQKFKQSGIKNIQLFELALSQDSSQRGMSSSGMIVINPPWTLFDKMEKLLPKFVETLSIKDEGFFRCEILAHE